MDGSARLAHHAAHDPSRIRCVVVVVATATALSDALKLVMTSSLADALPQRSSKIGATRREPRQGHDRWRALLDDADVQRW